MGNIQRIWDEYTGVGVHVGVFDDGVQYNHPDLAANYDASKHFSYNNVTYNPFPITRTGTDPDAHGTSVAGLIAAARNGVGGVGVAYGAKITGVNMLSDPALQTDAMADRVLRYGAAFDVMSNSWGYTPYFEAYQNAGLAGSTSAQIIAAYDYNTSTGRHGLGTVIVHAAGNDASNANADGLNTARSLISVAALDRSGSLTSYSNTGANIWISAGAAAVTTDLTGSNGYNTTAGTAGDYQSTFGGTSAATPVVAGVVALMLDANEGLGWRDVKEILANSASLTGSIVGGSSAYETTGTRFQVIDRNTGAGLVRDGDSWNDGGRAISWDYGFGRVNAFAAVRLAEVWTLINGPAQTSANDRELAFTNPTDVRMAFAGGRGTAASSVACTTHMEIDYISVTLGFDFTAPSGSAAGLSITLLGPGGASFDLVHAGDLYYSDVHGGWTRTYGVAEALGLDAFGTWTAVIRDSSSSLSGHACTLQDLKISFSGDASFDSNNIHHITQDFLKANAVNLVGLRDRAINDTNGGTDWLQMATLSGNVVVSLVAGQSFSVSGVAWGKIAAGTQIENVVTGDGNDRITGNNFGNKIYGMRGNDTMAGGTGADTLDGGQGNDSMLGGDGNDLAQAGIGNDVLWGQAGNDTLFGEAGNDTLLGGDGIDRLSGGADADRIDGGTGADVLSGELGADLFVFNRGYGGDRVADFQDNMDTIVLDDALWGNAALTVASVVTQFARVVSGSVVLDFGNGDVLTLAGLGTTAALLDDITII
jgi:Ca2+-binding RTX toxin-like protein